MGGSAVGAFEGERGGFVGKGGGEAEESGSGAGQGSDYEGFGGEVFLAGGGEGGNCERV